MAFINGKFINSPIVDWNNRGGNKGKAPLVSTDDNPVVPTSPSQTMSPEEVLKLMASQSAGNVNVGTDLQNQAKLDSAKATLDAALKALEENQDPAKMEELQKAVDEALENYQKVVDELAEAGYLRTETTETPATKANGGKTVTDEIFSKGLLLCKTVTKYDSDGNIIERIKTTYIYDEQGRLETEVSDLYDSDNKRIARHEKMYDTERGDLLWDIETRYFYDKQGISIGYICKFTNNMGNVSISEHGCDKNGQPLIGRDGEELYKRETAYNQDGELDKRMGAFGIVCASSEWAKDGTVKLYDEKGRLIGIVNLDGEETTIRKFSYDDEGRLATETVSIEKNSEIELSITVTYDYNDDGSYTATMTKIDSNGRKTISSKYFDTEGNVTKTVVEHYNEDGDLIHRTTYDGEPPTEPDEPVAPTEPSDVDVSSQDASKLLQGLGSAVELTGWISSFRKNPKLAINRAVIVMAQQIGNLAGKLKSMGYDAAKVDAAANAVKSYYSGLLNSLYDDDNGLKKKGETCDTRFTYTDANGNKKSVNTSFRHYAFDNPKKADAKSGQATSESASGVALLENWASNHGYKIVVDMKAVANMLIDFFNAL